MIHSLDSLCSNRGEWLATERTERKYLVREGLASHVAARLGGRLRLVGERTEITTLYFDTSEAALLHEAEKAGRALKVRVKAYAGTPSAWLELKVRDGERSGKTRSEVDWDHVSCLARRATRLRPSCIVRYTRDAWSGYGGDVRVTIDRSVRFFAVAGSNFADYDPNVGAAPLGGLDRAVLEVKLRRRTPGWLRELLVATHAPPRTFSKFVAASRAVSRSHERRPRLT